MLENDRQEQILYLLKEKKYMKPKELSDSLFISISTIRRDLIHLEKLGLIQRSHGQVSIFKNKDQILSHRLSDKNNEKKYIANIAASYIENGHTLFLDSSTTSNALCSYINQFKNLTILTNSIKNATDLSLNPDNDVIVIGGLLKHSSLDLLDEHTAELLKKYNTDLSFFSCKNLDINGVYESDFHQGYLKNSIINNSNHPILLTDSSKLHKKDFFMFSTYKDINTIILEEKPDKVFIDNCQQFKCEIVW